MPKKTYHKQNYRKKRNAKKKLHKSLIVCLQKKQPIPAHAFVRFSFITKGNITGATAGSATGSNIYSISYRPNANGTFNAAYVLTTGFASTDNFNAFSNYCGLAGLYQSYRPLTSTCKARLVGEQGESTRAYDLCVIPITGFIGAQTSYRVASQSQNSKVSTRMGNTFNEACVTNAITMHKLWGCRKQQVLDDNNFEGAYNAVPMNQSMWQVYWQSSDQSQSVNPVGPIEVEITMICKLEDPNYLGSSD